MSSKRPAGDDFGLSRALAEEGSMGRLLAREKQKKEELAKLSAKVRARKADTSKGVRAVLMRSWSALGREIFSRSWEKGKAECWVRACQLLLSDRAAQGRLVEQVLSFVPEDAQDALSVPAEPEAEKAEEPSVGKKLFGRGS